MKLFKKFIAVFTVILLFACDSDTQEVKPTVLETVISDSNLSSFLLAIQEADPSIANLLNANGHLTVLAPSNEAFTDFLNTNGYNNVGDIPEDTLTELLLNHILPVSVTSDVFEGFGAGYTSTRANGPSSSKISIYFNTLSGVRFNGQSSILTRDILANNGVIHIVDAVIDLPTIITFVESNPNFSSLAQALTTSTPNTDFEEILTRTSVSNPDNINPNFTLLAPNNTAFNALTELPEEDELTQILLHHIADELNLRSVNFISNGNTTLTSLEGDEVLITLPATGSNLANVTDGAGNTNIGIVGQDIQAINGIIHTVNKVLIPNME